MKLLLSIFFAFIAGERVKAQTLFSGISPEKRDSILQLIKGIHCKDEVYKKASFELLGHINYHTEILYVYYAIEFNVNKFNYKKNVFNYLNFEKENPVMWLINTEEHAKDSVFAVATQAIDNRNCYLLAPPSKTFRENHFYKILVPVLNKVDLQKSYIFYISGSTEELLILTKGSVYVIEGDKLVAFNDYYKTRYKLKEFKKLFK